MKKIRKMICIAAIALMACFACTACGTTYQEAVSEEYATDDSICGNYFTTFYLKINTIYSILMLMECNI